MKLQVLIDKKFEGNIKNSKPYIRERVILTYSIVKIH